MPDKWDTDVIIPMLLGGIVPIVTGIYIVNAIIEAGTDIPMTLDLTLSILKGMSGLTIGAVIIALGVATLKKNETQKMIQEYKHLEIQPKRTISEQLEAARADPGNLTGPDIPSPPKSRSRMIDDETDI